MTSPDQPKKGMSPVVIILIVVAGFGVFVVLGIGVLGAMGVMGTRKYLDNAKRAEGKNGAAMLARGMAACAASERASTAGGIITGLPPTSHPVPATLADLKGKKYQSSDKDWADPAFKCAHFTMDMPQYFQYQWKLVSPTKGTAQATADLDGDGTPDATIEVDVECSAPTVCHAAPPREK